MTIAQLKVEEHKNLRIRQGERLGHLATLHYLPLLVTEFAHACIEFPIVFLKHSETGRFQPVAMMSLSRGRNEFVKGEQWLGLYLPAAARQAPFRLIASEAQPNDLYIGIDPADPQISDTEGERLFDDEGRETPYLQKRKQDLKEFAKGTELTAGFVGLLTRHGLLRETKLTIDAGDHGSEVAGLFVVDEERLNAMDAETYIDLRDRGFLSIVYAHLLSLHQVRRLASSAGRQAAD